MKTFKQFLSEAERPAFASQRGIKDAERYLQSAESKKAPPEHPVAKRRREAEEAKRASVQGATTVSAGLRARLRAQVEVQREASKPKPKPPEQASKPIQPKQIGLRYMRPDKPNIPLSLDSKLIPKAQRLSRPATAQKPKAQKTRQLRLRGT
jgi:hypothetical protein